MEATHPLTKLSDIAGGTRLVSLCSTCLCVSVRTSIRTCVKSCCSCVCNVTGDGGVYVPLRLLACLESMPRKVVEKGKDTTFDETTSDVCWICFRHRIFHSSLFPDVAWIPSPQTCQLSRIMHWVPLGPSFSTIRGRYLKLAASSLQRVRTYTKHVHDDVYEAWRLTRFTLPA